MIAIDFSMPKCCDDCFCNNDCHACSADDHVRSVWKYYMNNSKPDWCPLIELDHPDFSGSYINPDDYVRVGDIMDCLSEVLRPESDLMHIEGLFEWAIGKRAVSKKELWDSWEKQFEEEEVLCE